MKKLKRNQIAIILLGGLFSLALLKKMPPAFFDIFGLATFSFLSYVGWKMLKTRGETSDNIAFLLFWIGLMGLIIDSINVLKTYGGVH